jgi:tetratricopeptide (TPR) repeat protein/O-antigen ligase
MSVVSRPLDRPASPVARRTPLQRFTTPLLAIGLVGLLLGSGPPLAIGFGCTLAAAWTRRQSLVWRGPMDAAWIALMAGSLLGLLVSHDQPSALSRLGAVAAAMTIFVLARGAGARPWGLQQASWLVVGICGIGALAILALIRGSLPDNSISRVLRPLLSLFAVFPGVSGDVLVVNSRFPVHQYGLAYLLLVVGPFLTAWAVLGAGRVWRGIAAIGLVGLAVLLAATEARGALLALAVAVALVASLRSRWFWGLLPLGGLAVYFLLARGIISRSIEADWLAARLSIWTRSLYLLGDYPLTGAGLGLPSFAEVFAWSYQLPNPYLVVHSHNIFIQAYAEQGLLGLVGLLLLLVGALLLGWQGLGRVDAAARPALAGVVGALSGSLLYGLTDQVPTTNYGLVLLGAISGLAVSGQPTRQPATGDLLTDDRAVRAPPNKLGPFAGRYAVPLLVVTAVTMLVVGVAPRWISGLTLNAGSALLTEAALDRSLSNNQRGAKLQQAEAVLGTAVDWNSKNSAAFRQLARVRLLRHDVPGARMALGAAIATANLNDHERTQLGRLALEMGFWQQAFDLWQAAGQSELLSKAADELTAKSEFKGATAAQAALVEISPDNPEHLSNLAKAILADGGVVNVDQALSWFNRAAELKPEARRSLARQLVLQAEDCRTNERRDGGRFEVCLFWFGLASRVDPSYDKPEVELGSVYFYRGRFGEAAEHFRLASEREPTNPSTWHQLGQAEEGAGRRAEAVVAFEQAVRLAPRRASLHASLGRVYRQLGRCDDAQRSLTTALSLPVEGDSSDRAWAELAQLGTCH